MKRLIVSAVFSLSFVALAQAPRTPPPAPAPPAAPAPPQTMFMFTNRSAPGIPAHVAQKLGLTTEQTKKVRELGFDANEAVIPLEADLKRAQLDFERAVEQANPDEATVLAKVEVVGRAELAIRKNRLALMLKIRKLLGPETWEKLQGLSPMMMHSGEAEFGEASSFSAFSTAGQKRREVRVIKNGDGTQVITETNE